MSDVWQAGLLLVLLCAVGFIIYRLHRMTPWRQRAELSAVSNVARALTPRLSSIQAPNSTTAVAPSTPNALHRATRAELQAELTADPQKLGYATKGQDYPAIASLLNATGVLPNPVKPVALPKRLTTLDIFAAITPAEALEVYKLGTLKADVEIALAGNDRAGMAALLSIVASLLSENSQAAIGALLMALEPDPDYQATVSTPSRATELGWQPITAAQVQDADCFVS